MTAPATVTQLPTVPEAAPAPAPVPVAPKQRGLKAASNKITDVRIVLGFNAPDGTRQESMYYVDPDEYEIDAYSFSDEGKIAKAKNEEGNLVGFEPTGERVLQLKVKYHTNDP